MENSVDNVENRVEKIGSVDKVQNFDRLSTGCSQGTNTLFKKYKSIFPQNKHGLLRLLLYFKYKDIVKERKVDKYGN